ncbi:AraC-like DNA-binding protein [Paenibacillus phyllosphaerae]|uniref:AraC-like DNA-binding protein n=1 Tax=Paenibacillus phyllosphaerae TaxID=274593 RepID=A0A7W5AZG8_9BACL|nr:helix-turn-helix domain-containing protein [Paenibacillus phyllosphaerae]MBB3111619.1 AraC-like DNA-binding protein [Paenibacillus phyllosphaerae]
MLYPIQVRDSVNRLLSKLPASKGRFYRRSLILFLIVSAIPGMIIGALIYGIAGGRMESELLQLHHNQIEQRVSNIDEQFTNLELMLSHWAFDSTFNYSLYEKDFERDFEVSRDITNTLLLMQGSSTMVKRVELFVGGQAPVAFAPEYSRLASREQLSVYEELLNTDQSTYWTKRAFDPKQLGTEDLTLVHLLPGGSMKPFGALIVRLDGDKVGNMLRTMTPYNEGVTFMIEENGEINVSAGEGKRTDPFLLGLKSRIEARSDEAGSFFYDWQGTTYTVSYGAFDRIADRWSYVSASPITSITSPVLFISKLVFAVSVSALLLAALLAWLASRSMYSPIRRLVSALSEGGVIQDGYDDEFQLIEKHWHHLNRESRELQSKLTEQLPHVKESFLHQLLQGYLYAYSEADLIKRMEGYKWNVAGRRFVVLYVQLTGIASLEGKFKSGDEGLLTFAAVNMIEELASVRFEQANAINFHDLAAGLLVTLPESEDSSEALQSFCSELAETINHYLKMNVTIAVSKLVDRVSDIPHAFEAVKQAAGYRNCENKNQFIALAQAEFHDHEPTSLQYPSALERELLAALRTGREADTHELLRAFLESLSMGGAKENAVQQGMLDLLSGVRHAIMAAGIDPNRLYKGNNLYEQLSQIRESSRMLNWFEEKVLQPFQRELAGRSGNAVKQLIEEARQYMGEHYMKDISLDSCADRIGTNPFYLSRSFKQVTGTNFIDYLTELRMERAKELLRDSELRINDVAEQVGYQHSYFNRIFKKLEGTTPSRYREMSRSV